MATNETLTEYESKRLENIKRNSELFASLNIKSKLAGLSTKRHRAIKVSQEKKPKSETLTVARKSLRNQGKEPDSPGLTFTEPPKKSTNVKSQFIPNKSPRELGPISMTDSSIYSKSDESLVNKILSVCKESQLKDDGNDDGDCVNKCMASIDLESMELAPENIACVVPNKIMSIKLFPSPNMRMVAVGNKFGNVGFWNADSDNEEGDGIYMYHPHPGPVSAIVIQPFLLNKIITSCYHGQIRSLDVEKEIFGLAYNSEHAIFSLSQRSNDGNSLYFGDSQGAVHSWDERSGRLSFTWDLHGCRINTIDFNSENTNMMATSSSDGTACTWDLRKSKPEPLKLITREGAVHSAYFSPSGSFLATTSLDDKIGVLSGENYDDDFLINHTNQSDRWPSSFIGVWGWDDSYIFVGSMNGGIDVISANKKRLVTTLESPHINAIPCRLDAHPLKPGMLAGSTNGRQVYIWNS